MLSLALAPLALAQEPSPQAEKPGFGDGMLVCYPNAPGGPRSAEPVMERLGTYLQHGLGRPCRPEFFNAAAPALEWVGEAKPRFAILSQALFLRWRKQLGLQVLALSERGGKVEDRFHLLVRADAPWKSLEDLQQAKLGRQAVIWSSDLEDPRFATRVVFGGDLTVQADDGGDVRVVSTREPLRVLRRLKAKQPFRGQPVDGVVVDDSTWRLLQKLSTFKGEVIRPLYSSPALPTPPVVSLEGVSQEHRDQLQQVLAGMAKDEHAAELLETLQVTGFRPADPDVFAATVEAYDSTEDGS